LADGADPALSERVGPGRANGSPDGLDADGGEHGVEAGGELGVAVAYEEPEAPTGLLELGAEVAGDLGDPGAPGVGGDAEQVHDAPFDLDHEKHVVATEEDGVDGEEVGGHDALGLGMQELLQRGFS